METPFEIGIVDKKKKQAFVYSTNYLRLEEYINDVALLLRVKSFKGKVVFDLLLSNGSAFNRFIEVFFDGSNFEIRTSKVFDANENILNNSLEFYNSHISYLDDSILTRAEKFLIKRKQQYVFQKREIKAVK